MLTMLQPVLFLVLLRPPEGVELAVLGDDPVPLGLSMDDPEDAGLLLERVPSVGQCLN